MNRFYKILIVLFITKISRKCSVVSRKSVALPAFFIFFLTTFLLTTYDSFSQGVAINTTGTAADASAMLDVTSTNAGLLIPRMTLAQRNSIATPATSLLVYQTDGTAGYYYYNGTAWVSLFSNNTGWSLSGNDISAATGSFLGTTSNNDLIFKTNNAEVARILANGNMGIGTTNPASIFDIRNSTGILRLESTTGTNEVYLRLTNASNQLYMGISNSAGNAFAMTGELPYAALFLAPSNRAIQLGTTAAGVTNANVTILPGGMVGIGTTSPVYPLAVQTTGNSPIGLGPGAGSATGKVLDLGYFETSDYGYLQAQDKGSVYKNIMINPNGGSVGVGTINLSAKFHVDAIGGLSNSVIMLQHASAGGTAPRDRTGFLDFKGDGAGVNARIAWHHNDWFNYGTDLSFWTTEPSGTNVLLERLRITTNGNVGIGTTAPTALLSVNGNANNTTGVWGVFSDRRLKRDIEPLQGALSKILQLQGVTFCWKDSAQNAQLGRVRGFIAQDVEKVIPEWVKTTSNGFKQLETIGMDAMLVEAIKEQQLQIEKLQNENNKVKSENQNLKVEIGAQDIRIKKLEEMFNTCPEYNRRVKAEK